MACQPAVGMRYRKGGFEFRVDCVVNGEVYVARWKIGESPVVRLMRVEIAVWNLQMRGGWRGCRRTWDDGRGTASAYCDGANG